MATLNDLGNLTARCPGCGGALTRFEYRADGNELGAVRYKASRRSGFGYSYHELQYRLFRCVGCGMGGLGVVQMKRLGGNYPSDIDELRDFEYEAPAPLDLPHAVPAGIAREFREAERCLANGTRRAAAAMFRSALDKTLRANGYKTKRERLWEQIDEAAADGVITATRQKRAHEDIRVLGNDVLHDDWQPVSAEDVEAAHHYTQRILEDFYDDREEVLKTLRDKGRVPAEDLTAAASVEAE
jgi:hypothetical protein